MSEQNLTGYPSIDKPWLKYYNEEAINAPLPECTIYEYLWESNKNHLDDIALNYFGKKITYGELFENIEKAAKGFSAIGVKDGDIVTIFSSNTPETVYCIYALNLLGAITNMEYVTESLAESISAIKKCKSKTVVILEAVLQKFSSVSNSEVVENIVILPVSASMPTVKRVFYNSKRMSSPVQKGITYKYMLKHGMHYKRMKYIKDKPAVIVHSGGTTGTPKGVVLSNDNLNSIAWQYKSLDAGQARKDLFLHTIPCFHAFGIGTGIHMPLVLGFQTIMMAQFSEKSILKNLYRYKPQHLFVAPSHANTIIENFHKKTLSWLKTFALGGTAISEKQENQIKDFLTQYHSLSKPLIGYGMSELSSAICYETNLWYGKTGSVGIPFCKANVKILDTDTQEEKKYNESGELCFSGPGLMLEYYKNREETINAVFEDVNGIRWIRSGDIGYIDSDGFIFVTSRIKRIYITRVKAGETGYKLYPDYIALQMHSLSFIKDCAVVCIEDPIYKNIAVAFVVLNPDENIDESAIFTKLKSVLPEHSLPKKIVITDELPLTPIGKIDYRALEKEAEKL